MENIREPLISVIIPIYNGAKTLLRALESIKNQTYLNFEAILVDDGSTDCSKLICQEYVKTDSRFRLYSKKNGGVSSARNLGLDNAKGEWITFFDVDDIVYENWLKDFNVSQNQTYDIICQGISADKPIAGPSAKLKEFGFDFKGEIPALINELTVTGLLGYAVIKCFKRSIIELYKIHFDTKVRFQEDELFVIEYLRRSKYGVSIDVKNYFYYVPDWGKYRNQDLGNSIYRVEKVFNILLEIFEQGNSSIIIDKTNRLNLLIMESLVRKPNVHDLKKLHDLYKRKHGYSKMPAILQKFIGHDITCLTLSFLLLIYSFKRIISPPSYI